MQEQIQTKLIEEEMKSSYIDYSMSVITARAIPDVRDGLKPVHRRILYSMDEMGLMNTKPFTKCARIVGDCFKYHPHGDAAIYDSLVRMAQDFSLRYPLINGHGNFGSIDFSSPAQMRYTEARLSKIGEELLFDLDKNVVDFVPNFDGSLKEPVVLPTKVPNLLINGSSGIAVGMATNIPPHNIIEVVDASMAAIDNPNITINEIMQYVKGPDFPTGAYISGLNGIKQAYETGKGKIIVKAKTEIEERNERKRIIVKEIPYMVNKSILIEEIADLVRDGVIDNVSDIRDESDRDGMRIVIELKRGANPDLTLNQIYAHTAMKITFGIIMLALKNNEPVVMNLRDIIFSFINHRKDVVTRRTRFDLERAEDRAHILDGLKVAIEDIDNTVKIIKSSDSVDNAKRSLIENFKLSEKQAIAVLEMRLQRLASLETEKLRKEHEELLKLIQELREILAEEKRVYQIIKNELMEIKEKYGDKRRTQILHEEETIEEEELIKEEDVVITITNSGYIKRLPLSTYKQQKRAGYGVIGTETREEDFVEQIFVTNNLNYLLFFTNKGRVFWLKAYQVPEGSRYSGGKAIVNLLKLGKDERVSTVYPIQQFMSNYYLIMATKNGMIKKSELSEFSRIRKSGIRALKLRDNDALVYVSLTQGNSEIILATKNGKACRFNEQDVRPMGRNASGVRAIKLEKGDEVIGMEIVEESDALLTITEKGFGKRTRVEEYRKTRRGGKGVTNVLLPETSGKVVATKAVNDNDEIILMSEKGVVIRVSVKDISIVGRATKGVIVMRLKENDKIKSVAKLEREANNSA